MQTHDLIPNTPAWHAFRATHRGASDAPAMMGCSPHKTRAQLLDEKKTGIEREQSSFVQERVLTPGHTFEALARPLAAAIIGEDLYPVVGSDGRLSASFDGLTLGDDIAWEHKTLNDELRAVLPTEGFGNGAALPLRYRVQMEQQCMVSGAGRALFTASKWAGDKLVEARHAWYDSDAVLAEQIRAGWAQFHADLATHVPRTAKVAPVAKVVPALPIVFDMRVEGRLVACNLEQYKPAAMAYIESFNTKLVTDEDFVNAAADAKWCRDSADKLELAIEQALGQMGDINAAIGTVREIAAAFDAKGLKLENLVKTENLNRRAAMVTEAQQALAAHIATLVQRIGKPYMPTIPADFAGVMKGLRSLDSMQSKVATELARAKIAASSVADTISINLAAINELAADKPFLFSDLAALVLKAPDDCKAVITNRLTAHKAAEEKRLADERQRIQADEERKAREKVAEEQRQREAADAESRRRLEDEERTRLQAGAATLAAASAPPPAPAAAPVAAAPAVVPLRRAAPVTTAPTLTLGTIATRLGFSVPAAFLATLGFEAAGRERAAVLYHEADFPRICDALIARIQEARQPLAA